MSRRKRYARKLDVQGEKLRKVSRARAVAEGLPASAGIVDPNVLLNLCGDRLAGVAPELGGGPGVCARRRQHHGKHRDSDGRTWAAKG